MALHQHIQSILLAGARFPTPAPAAPPVSAPPALAGLIAMVAAEHATCDRRAVQAGNRYRSAFWSLYLLSALAVLCALVPLALGWNDPAHALHAWAPSLALLEVAVIAMLGLIYWRGRHQDWQGQWLASRMAAELAWYLPVVAPLVAPAPPGAPANWYARLAANSLHLPEGGEIDALCARLERYAARSLQGAWSERAFVGQYVAWAVAQFGLQRRYHQRQALRNEALMRRIHRVNEGLFGLTLAGALAHLFLHSAWLAVVTVFCPALGAWLHGALAQSEAYRLAATSWRLAAGLQNTMDMITASHSDGDCAKVRWAIEAGLTLILNEHRDWHMLVRPHHLPLG
jgi:hypothetical protein